MLCYDFHKNLWLGGGNSQFISPVFQPGQHFFDSRVQLVFENTNGSVSLPVNLHCLSCSFLIDSCIFFKLLQKGRSYENTQLLKIRFRLADFLQCVLYRFGDSLTGICKGSI